LATKNLMGDTVFNKYQTRPIGHGYKSIKRKTFRGFTHTKKGLTVRTIPLIFMARLARLERATYGLEVRCSIQLSYRRIQNKRSGLLADIPPFVHRKDGGPWKNTEKQTGRTFCIISPSFGHKNRMQDHPKNWEEYHTDEKKSQSVKC
jgi:hypothetical protein